MTKPDDIPEDVWEAAVSAHIIGGSKNASSQMISSLRPEIRSTANAILEERERCAKVAEAATWLPKPGTNAGNALVIAKITSGHGKEIAAAIRKGGPT